MLESLSPQLVFCVCARPARQDHLLPYMADCRHAPDTLFLVAEEDFRLTREHAALTPQHMVEHLSPGPPGLQEVPGEATTSLSDLYRLRTSVTPLQGGSAAGATCEPLPTGMINERAVLGFYRRRQKPTAAELQNVSQELEDLVKICTYAHRKQAGSLVWLSWCGGPGGKSRKRRFSVGVARGRHPNFVAGIAATGLHVQAVRPCRLLLDCVDCACLGLAVRGVCVCSRHGVIERLSFPWLAP